MSDKTVVSPLWISHRGLKENAAENTLAAFTQAVAAGFSALETDLRLSKDNHIVLSHDASLERLSGDPRYIAELTRSELEKIQLQGGDKLCFLESFMSGFHNTRWIFDIKPEQGRQTIQILAEQIEHACPEKASEIRFCTWREKDETLLRRFFPQAGYYARKAECWQAGLAVFLGVPAWGRIEARRTYAIPPHLGRISLYRKSMIESYHRRSARTIAFLPQLDSDIEAALLVNFDEILTDGRIRKAEKP
jgi:glycerophosphoryl diester phosphodiesterase